MEQPPNTPSNSINSTVQNEISRPPKNIPINQASTNSAPSFLVSTSNKPAKIFLSIFGIVMFFFSFLVFNSGGIPASYLQTDGVVVQSKHYISGGRPAHAYFSLVIQFKVDSKNYTFLSQDEGLINPPSTKGDVVKVWYDPANPGNNPINGHFKDYIVYAWILIAAGVASYISIGLLTISERKNQKGTSAAEPLST